MKFSNKILRFSAGRTSKNTHLSLIVFFLITPLNLSIGLITCHSGITIWLQASNLCGTLYAHKEGFISNESRSH